MCHEQLEAVQMVQIRKFFERLNFFLYTVDRSEVAQMEFAWEGFMYSLETELRIRVLSLAKMQHPANTPPWSS